MLRTPGPQQDMQLGLAEVGIGGAQAPDLLAQRRRLQGLTAPAGRAGAGGQGRGRPVGLGERLLPAIERAPADPERLTGRCLAVTGEELQNGESVLSRGDRLGRDRLKHKVCTERPTQESNEA